MIKGILVDVKNKKAEVKTVHDSLETYYELLNTDVIDIVDCKIDDKYFTIVCDDIGFLRNEVIVSALSSVGEIMLVGNLFITGHAGGGENLISLSDDDLKTITSNIYMIESDPHPIVGKCEY